jgi:carbonic anhydrase/acetyltransferase-like protein (isoleucine patch superfamily)
MRTLTASDRSILTILASSLPAGSRERRAILAGLAKRATEFSSKEELAKYLKEHPKADPKKHSVKEKGGKGEGKSREIKSADGNDPHHVMRAAGGNKVFMGNYTVKHLQTHAQPGKGSVFSGKIKPEDISAAINKIPAKFFEEGGGAFEIDVPNAGSDLVQKSSDILKKYPNAKKITVPKQEGVVMGEDGKPKMGDDGKPIPKMVDVTAYVVDDGEDAFSTNKMTVVMRPANPQFMPEEAKKDEELSGALNDKKGFAVLTAFPGKKDVPKASEWGDEYAIIVPNGGKGADADVQKALGSSKKGSVTHHPQDRVMRKLSSSDRSALIKLASSLPSGSPERRAILAGLSKSSSARSEFNIPGKHILDRAEVFDNVKVYDNAKVYGDAKVYDNAKVSGKAKVYDKATVYGEAKVFDNAMVYGDSAKVGGKALVYGKAKVYDDALVYQTAAVFGQAEVFGNASVGGDADISGNAQVYGKAIVEGKAQVSGKARIGGDAVIIGGKWDGSEGPIMTGIWKGPGVPV